MKGILTMRKPHSLPDYKCGHVRISWCARSRSEGGEGMGDYEKCFCRENGGRGWGVKRGGQWRWTKSLV